MHVLDTMRSTGTIAAIALAVTTMLPAPTEAAACQQAKLNATAKKTAGKIKCHTKAVKLGTPVSTECLDVVELKFQAAFARADAKGGCPTTGNDGVVETAVDQCVTSILSALGAGSPPAPPAACLQAKMKAAGKKAQYELKCWAKAAAKGLPVDAECLSKAELKFELAFTKAELKTGCAQTGDATSVEAAVDVCVASLVGLLPPPTTTTSTTSSSTSSSTSTTLPVCTGSEPGAVSGITAAQNTVRATASPTPVPPLAPFCWSSTVAATAQSWANGCQFAHNPALGSLGYGENIYAAVISGSPPPGYNPPIAAVTAWASEAADYHYPTNSCSGVCGHYTQLVWRASEAVGCGIKACTTNSPFGPSFPIWTLVVCDYNPAGNFVGQRPY